MRIVLFDLDDTLLDHSSAATEASARFHARWQQALRLDLEAFHARWHALMVEGFRRYAAGEITHMEQRRYRMRGLFEAPLDDAEADARFESYLADYEQHWRLFDDALPCLDALAACPDTRIGMITNGSPAHQAKKLARTGLEGRFECVVTPGDGLLGKPHRSIFDRACDALNVAAEACTYIGDQLDTDARGARGAGLRGVWLDRARSGLACDVPVAHDLDEVLQWLTANSV